MSRATFTHSAAPRSLCPSSRVSVACVPRRWATASDTGPALAASPWGPSTTARTSPSRWVSPSRERAATGRPASLATWPESRASQVPFSRGTSAPSVPSTPSTSTQVWLPGRSVPACVGADWRAPSADTACTSTFTVYFRPRWFSWRPRGRRSRGLSASAGSLFSTITTTLPSPCGRPCWRRRPQCTESTPFRFWNWALAFFTAWFATASGSWRRLRTVGLRSAWRSQASSRACAQARKSGLRASAARRSCSTETLPASTAFRRRSSLVPRCSTLALFDSRTGAR